MSLSLVHRATVAAFRWIAFLAAFALAWWKGGVRPAAWVFLAALAASAAMLLSEGWATIASGVFLGILAQWGFRLAFRRETASDPTAAGPPANRRSTVASPAAPLGILLLAAATAILLYLQRKQWTAVATLEKQQEMTWRNKVITSVPS